MKLSSRHTAKDIHYSVSDSVATFKVIRLNFSHKSVSCC